jgi:hypothetical protein
MLPAVAAVCGVCTIIESLPINHWLDDNLSVPIIAAAMATFLLPAAGVVVASDMAFATAAAAAAAVVP